jgi:hypothetical protein
MSIIWDEINKSVIPIKGYEDLYRRMHTSFEYPFVGNKFNFSLPQLIDYTKLGVGGDPQGRYTEYASNLIRIFTELHKAGVQNTLDLMALVETHQTLEEFCEKCPISGQDIVSAVKYLIYWFIPMEKYMSGLVKDDPVIRDALKVLRGIGIRTNLDLLQRGIHKAERKALADESGLPEAEIEEWINRADLSRLPWASRATISNIMGAGYGSLARLANANPEQLFEDFYRYGKSIGKNLKFGNEIENSYRIAKIVPVILQ